MPETKRDNPFESHIVFMVVGMIVATVVGAALYFVAAQQSSAALWIVLGVPIAGVAFGGIAYSALIFRYYSCPQCRCRLSPEKGPRRGPLRIRYYCERCDTIWDSGVTWGGE